MWEHFERYWAALGSLGDPFWVHWRSLGVPVGPETGKSGPGSYQDDSWGVSVAGDFQIARPRGPEKVGGEVNISPEFIGEFTF